ncbi:MAG TPA: DsbE family thiol:disulfide interchange protein [Nevskiaceae bacterium]|nr:DsbE family thiol:disulfide interchange protein [Nevskiaceae bacterium]
MRFAIPVVVLVLLLVVLRIGLKHDPREVPSPLIGKPAPAFSLPVLDADRTLSLESLKGRTVLVNFFASWCAGCQVEHPLLLKLARRDQVPIVGMDYKDEPADGREWLARRGNPYETVAIDRQGAVGLDWGVYGVPETYVVGPDGTILYKHIGPVTEEAWRDRIAPLMGRTAVAGAP